MNRAPLIALAFILAAEPARPGIPVETEMTCPVGGEVFTITETASCSTMGRTMSFKPLTSCDFVTRMPVCPGNGLPVYDDFTEVDIAMLTTFVETDDFAALRQLPPFLRAYGTARHLGDEGSEAGFWLLLNAHWYEPEAFLKNASALDTFIAETDAHIARAPDDEAPFLNAILGYALLRAGRTEAGEARLSRADAEGPDHLKSYVAQVRACVGDFEHDGCRPDDPLRE